MRSEVISRILPHYSWHQIPQLLSVRKEAKSHLSERLWLISTRRKPPLFLLSALHFYKNEYFLIQFYIKLDIFEYHKVKKNRYHIPFVGEKNYKNKDSGSNAQSKCFSSSQFSSVAQFCLTLCNPMDCPMPGVPVHLTNSQSLLNLLNIESVMPFNSLILCRPLLLLHSIFPSKEVFSNELFFISGVSTSASVLPMNIQD